MNIYLLALLYNFSLLLINRGFSDDSLTKIYPEVFSFFGQFMILIWGLVFYVSQFCINKWLLFIFFIEKLTYTITGIYWMINRSHQLKFNDNPIEYLFMRVYWLGDFTFAIYFLYVCIHS